MGLLPTPRRPVAQDFLDANIDLLLGGPLGEQIGIERTIASFKTAIDADDSLSLQAAVDYARNNQAIVRGDPKKKRYRISSPLTVNLGYGGLDMMGASITTGSTYSGDIVRLTNLIVDSDPAEANFRGASPIRAGFRNFNIVGPGRGANNSVGINMIDPSFGIIVENGRIQDVDIGITWGNNSFINTFLKVDFNHVRVAVYSPAGNVNSGERISFGDMTIANCDQAFDITGSYVNFGRVSVDYCLNEIMRTGNGGHIWFKGFHCEHSALSVYWGRADSGSSINFEGGSFVPTGQTGQTRTLPLFFADPATRASVNFSGTCVFNSVNGGWSKIPYIVDGFGTMCYVAGLNLNLPMPPSHSRRNLLSDSQFNLGYLRDWANISTTASGALITSVAGNSVAGGGLRIKPGAGEVGGVALSIDVTPNEQLLLSLPAQLTGATADNTYINWQWKGADGADLGSSITTTFTPSQLTTGSFDLVRSMAGPAPIGATRCHLTINKGNAAVTGVSDGIGQVNFDNAVLTSIDGRLTPLRNRTAEFTTRKGALATTPINPEMMHFVSTAGTTSGLTLTSLPDGLFYPGTRTTIGDPDGSYGTKPLTLTAPGTKTFRGGATSLVINVAWSRVTLEWDGTTIQYWGI